MRRFANSILASFALGLTLASNTAHTPISRISPQESNSMTLQKKVAGMTLIRNRFTNKSTIGKLYINGQLIGYTLELPWKNNQKNNSCIPPGEYRVAKRSASKSSRFNYDHLEILDVPERSNILMHVGNYPEDTTGCPLIGETAGQDNVQNSKDAFAGLMGEINKYDEAVLRVVERR